jgi:dihydroneopterin aldolase/D-erythro-7,8-dihydroneopterin triphosphate epimerase
MSDTIFIDDLLVRCIIGIHDWERKARQDVLINIELDVSTAAAGASDDFADAVDYRALAKRVIEMAEASGYQLVEALAEEVARLSLVDDRVESVRVRVEKPGAVRFARSVGVTIERGRD